MKKKYVSLVKANSLIPKVTILVTELMKLNNALQLIESVDVEFEDEYEFMVNDIKSSIQLHKLYYEFYRKLDELIEIGVYVQDIDLGLINFFSRNNGHDIFLCWQLGEKKINYWYDVEEDYDDRKPINMLKDRKIQNINDINE